MADNQDKLYNGYIQMIKRNELFYENLLQSDLKYLLVFCALFRYIELNADKYKFFDKIYAVKNLRLLYGQTISRYELIDYISEFEKAHEIEHGLLSENFRTLTNDIGKEFGFSARRRYGQPRTRTGRNERRCFCYQRIVRYHQ